MGQLSARYDPRWSHIEQHRQVGFGQAAAETFEPVHGDAQYSLGCVVFLPTPV